MSKATAHSFKNIKEHMEVIGADGVHVGTVHNLKGDRIKLKRADSAWRAHEGHHHYLSTGLIAAVEGDKIRLSATGAVAVLFEEEKDHSSTELQAPVDDSCPPDDAVSDRKLWRWNRIGLGAAAMVVAGAASAAFLTRKVNEMDDFQHRLETDEDERLIASDKVENTPVFDKYGEALGTIQSFMVDKYTGRVAYAIMTFSPTMGLGDCFFPIPWALLKYSSDENGYSLDTTREKLIDAPHFGVTDTPEFDASYRARLSEFHERA